jgi:hypothetical protein
LKVCSIKIFTDFTIFLPSEFENTERIIFVELDRHNWVFSIRRLEGGENSEEKVHDFILVKFWRNVRNDNLSLVVLKIINTELLLFRNLFPLIITFLTLLVFSPAKY